MDQEPVLPTVNDTWAQTDVGHLFVRRWTHPNAGEKAPIILFHDSLGCVELWRSFPDLLCQRTNRTIVAYDRMGFGQSSPVNAKAKLTFIKDEAELYLPIVLHALGIKKFVAIGHSVGGAMAIHSAGHFPGQCQAVVSISTQSFVEELTLQGIRDAKGNFRTREQLQKLEKYHGKNARWVLNAWTETWLSKDFATWTLDAALIKVTCPVLALHGDKDEFGSVRQAEKIGLLVSGESKVEILKDCGHLPHREKDELVLSLVSQFLQNIP